MMAQSFQLRARMDTARQTCSICGAELTEPAEIVSFQCLTCEAAQTKSGSSNNVEVVTSGDVTPVQAGFHVDNGSQPAERVEPQASHSLPLAEDAPTPIDLTGVFHLVDANALDAVEPTVDLPPGEVTKLQEAATQQKNGRTKFGRFKVLSILGQGAFGVVYHAYDPLLDREVALKVPRFSQDDTAMMERFHREAKAAARLHHPNIVALYEHGQTDEGPYLVYEYVKGETLFKAIRQQVFDIRTAVDWVRQISDALYYAHSERIIHRDIKPANIMINQSGRPQVMDFGLAKRDVDSDSNVTMEGQILGTPNYMSPEQARGATTSTGAHSDQYSVGVVFYELLCGVVPFSGRPLVVMSRVGNPKDLPPNPRSIRPEIPRDLEAACLKALEKDPKLRYPSLQMLAEDLDHWLKGLPLVARPISLSERFTRWCRKNQLVASLTGTIAAILLVMSIVSPWLAFRFRNLATAADKAAKAAVLASQKETAARLDAERILINNYAESGLTADRSGDPRAAVLWFANAVAAAGNHPSLERDNRVRMQSWLSQFAVPVQAFTYGPDWNKTLSYHSDSQALLTVTEAGDGQWLDLATGTKHPISLTGPITAAAWSPDGRTVIAAAKQTVATFEYPAGRELERWVSDDEVSCFQFSRDGNLLVIGGHRSVQFRDVARRQPRCPAVQISSPVSSLEVSPDGGWFAFRSHDQQIHVYSIGRENGEVKAVMPPQPAASEGEIPPLFIAADRLVTFDSHEHAVRCWDLEGGKILWQQPINRALCMALSPSRQWLAVGDNSDIVVLDVTSTEPFRHQIRLRNLLHAFAFSPNSDRLLATCNDHLVHLFDIPSGRPACAPIPHNSAAHRCAWAPDGSTFTTVNWGGNLLRVWKPQAPAVQGTLPPDSASGPFARINSTGDRWIPCGFDGHRDRHQLEVIDTRTGKAVGVPLQTKDLISDADFIPNSTRLVVVGGPSSDRPMFKDQRPEAAGFVRIFDSQDGQHPLPEITTPTQPIAVRVSGDSSTAIVLCHLGQVLLVDIAKWAVRRKLDAFGGHESTHGYVIRDRIRISPKGRLFAVWGGHEVAEVYSLVNDDLKLTLRHDRDFIHDVQFSPDGRLIATCSSDLTARLWNAETGVAIGNPLTHPGWVFSAQFSSDSKRLLTACDDRRARLWDTATGLATVATHELPDQVFGACLLPDEDVFLACDRSGRLTAWETQSGKMIAPARNLGNMVYQLTVDPDSGEVIASGRIHPSRIFRWDDWIVKKPCPLSRTDMLLLGEVLSAQTISKDGELTNLTTADWIDRWNQLHSRHPVRAIVEGKY